MTNERVDLCSAFDLLQQCSVGHNSTLDLVQHSTLSSHTRKCAGCRVWLDVGPGKTKGAVECHSALDLVQRRAQWSVTQRWTWYNEGRSGVSLSVGPDTMKGAVECHSALDLVQRRAQWSVTQRWTWYNEGRSGVSLKGGPGTVQRAVECNEKKVTCSSPLLLHRPALSLVTVLTELSRVLFEHVDTESAVVARTVLVYSVQISQ
jgi:hypothetical protein